MGLLDRFRKEEKVHFVRNEAGEVVGTERSYSGRGSKTPISDRLLAEAKSAKQIDKKRFRQEQKDAFNKAFREARLKRMGERGRMAGGVTFSDRIDRYASAHQGRPVRSVRYSTKNNFNPFGSMFDTGMDYSPTPFRMKKGKKQRVKKFDMMDNWGFMK